MREILQTLDGQRLTFVATFNRYGAHRIFGDVCEQTVLLADVATLDGLKCTDHLWMACGARFDRFELKPGDVLMFDARVKPYHKRKVYKRKDGRFKHLSSILDYTLSYPSRISLWPALEQ